MTHHPAPAQLPISTRTIVRFEFGVADPLIDVGCQIQGPDCLVNGLSLL